MIGTGRNVSAKGNAGFGYWTPKSPIAALFAFQGRRLACWRRSSLLWQSRRHRRSGSHEARLHEIERRHIPVSKVMRKSCQCKWSHVQPIWRIDPDAQRASSLSGGRDCRPTTASSGRVPPNIRLAYRRDEFRFHRHEQAVRRPAFTSLRSAPKIHRSAWASFHH